MSDFRIFCELLAKMMLKAIDFTDVVEVYRRNEKPETLGIATFSRCVLFLCFSVEMKSPRHWALQQYYFQILCSFSNVEMKSPRHWALQRLGFQSEDFLHSRNEKPETLGIATSCCLFDS